MALPLKFVKLDTCMKGLMTRAIGEFNRYLDDDAQAYHWVCIDHPELMARVLEVLADDLPEEDIAQVATRLPYLIFLFHRLDQAVQIPVEATLAFLAILNRADMVTLLRQCSDRQRLAPFFQLDPQDWVPVFFMLAGVADLDAVEQASAQCSFFLAESY